MQTSLFFFCPLHGRSTGSSYDAARQEDLDTTTSRVTPGVPVTAIIYDRFKAQPMSTLQKTLVPSAGTRIRLFA